MNSLLLPSYPFISSLSCKSSPCLQSKPWYICSSHICFNGCNTAPLSHLLKPKSRFSLSIHQTSIGSTVPSDEGVVSVIDLIEKDWSFLDSDELNSEENIQKIDNIISAGEIDHSSRVLVSIGSEGFVDRVVDSSPCSFLLVVHDSLFVLACIKAKYDKVKCWQGELRYVPEEWAPLDVVFLYFLPALPYTLDQAFGALADRCSPGARVVISHPQGREILEQQREQFADVVISDLPDEMTLQKVAANHSFEIAKFVDEPGLYLAVLKFCREN
ncbi:uncharacterized protein LOC116114524 [Pistacia vera]|uniref:uncharacterized protein LOC116114524 n=1 Tax=Pistacia vera TaxID=55513 RepID=UPI0012634324|nr:uncharacterized protein LOC116114524 [Pistacia vera]